MPTARGRRSGGSLKKGALPLRILFLATVFPSPANPIHGPWALRQAQAIKRAGADVHVVRLSPWFPPGISKLGRIRRVADVPASYKWGDLEVQYLRWPLYQAGRVRRQSYVNPWLQAKLSFACIRSRLLHEIGSFHPDVIYAHHTWVSGYVAYRLHQLTSIPYIITDHDFDEIGDCKDLPKRKAFFQDVQSSASCLVDVSKRMQEIRHRIFPEINSLVVYNGADPIPENMFHAPRPVEIVGRTVISCVSMWYQRKGIPKLVEAFSAIGGEFPAAVLRLVGDGPDRPAVMAAVAASPVRDRIHILGSQPHERAMQEMCWSDMYALVGRDEPFATTFTEAMMAGLPLIWPDDCGHNDVLVDGANGVRVPPLDVQATATALRKLLADGEGRKEIGSANRNLAMATLTWDANAQAMIRIFSGGSRNSAGQLDASRKSSSGHPQFDQC